jgi:DNA-binding transcriptional MerR regulator
MRVKELAVLTGTTVRTIRYYHQIGLLPVPDAHGGVRDYDLVHVARLVHIRRLTQAGVPLARVAGMLPPDDGSGDLAGGTDREAILADLKATVTGIDEQIEALRGQREQVRRLIASVEQHDQLSPMPPAVVRFYDDMARRAGDERVRRLIRWERDFMELAFYRGEIPQEVEILYRSLDEARLAESLDLFSQVAGRPTPVTDEQIAGIAAAVVDRIRRHLGPELPRLARSIDPDLARHAADLYVRLSTPENRRRDRAIADALLATIEEARG